MAIEIVDFPSYRMVDLSIAMGQFTRGYIYLTWYSMVFHDVTKGSIHFVEQHESTGQVRRSVPQDVLAPPRGGLASW